MPPPAVGGGLRQASGTCRVTIEDPGRRRYGAFGERLITGLLETTRLEVIIAGRDEARLVALVARCNHTPRTVGPMRAAAAALDRRRVTPAILGRTGAFTVVNAAGPYQGGDYGLVWTAIGACPQEADLANARLRRGL
jgi:hypothetical protein